MREEMPLAMACLRTVFPYYMLSIPQHERAVEFSRVFEVREARSSDNGCKKTNVYGSC